MPLTKNERLTYASILWQDFKAKVVEDWKTKYEDYGKSIDNIQVSTKFSQALSSDIKKHLTAQNLQYKVPHHLTIDKYLKQDGFPTNVQEASLNVFSIYLGYESWHNFTKEKNRNLSSETSSPEDTYSDITESHTSKKYQGLSLTLFLSLILSLFAYKFLKKPVQKESTTIESVVKNSIAAEFRAYSLIPDTVSAFTSIDSFFIKTGSAHIDISNRISRITRRGWVLNNEKNPSRADLLSIEVESVKDGFAYVKTKEAWLIKWFETEITGYVYKYRVINEQDYILQKDKNGKWKVLSNTYKAEVGKELPSNFKREDFDTNIRKERLVKLVRKSIEEGLLDNALWNTSLYTSLHKLSIENDISILQGRYNNLVREWNLEKISRDKFLKEKEKTARQLLLMMEEL